MIMACMLSSTLVLAGPTPKDPPKGAKIASYQDVLDIFHQGGTVYDIRWHYSEYEFEGHIPFAKSVPFTEWSSLDVNYDITQDHWDWSVLPTDKNTPIAFYCMGVNCWKSYKVADEAAKRGHKNVWWYKGGQPEWDKLGLPIINSNPTYKPMEAIFKGKDDPTTWLVEPEIVKQWIEKKEKMQIIDIRFGAFFEEGRLNGAFNLPIKALLSRDGIQLMPKPQLKHKILLISDNGVLAGSAAVPLKALGYDVAVLNGGQNAWLAKYGKTHIVSGPMAVNTKGKKGWQGQIYKIDTSKK